MLNDKCMVDEETIPPSQSRSHLSATMDQAGIDPQSPFYRALKLPRAQMIPSVSERSYFKHSFICTCLQTRFDLRLLNFAAGRTWWTNPKLTTSKRIRKKLWSQLIGHFRKEHFHTRLPYCAVTVATYSLWPGLDASYVASASTKLSKLAPVAVRLGETTKYRVAIVRNNCRVDPYVAHKTM